MTHTCKQCGKEFESPKKTRRYCSLKCRGISYRHPLTTCKTCGTKFWKRGEAGAKYCSRVCSYHGHRGAQNPRWQGGQETKKKRKRAYTLKHDLRRKFGLSVGEYDQMLREQCGRCAICGEVETVCTRGTEVSRLSVDHCHSTGRVRGLLCRRCNAMLGFLEERGHLLGYFIKYLATRGE